MERQPKTQLDLKIFDPQKGHERLTNFAMDANLVSHDSISIRGLVQASREK